jgi:hypothetical protein
MERSLPAGGVSSCSQRNRPSEMGQLENTLIFFMPLEGESLMPETPLESAAAACRCPTT